MMHKHIELDEGKRIKLIAIDYLLEIQKNWQNHAVLKNLMVKEMISLHEIIEDFLQKKKEIGFGKR